ncbi:MAG: hypothetical protein V1816_06700 [Pseudomonadota bacterium]
MRHLSKIGILVFAVVVLAAALAMGCSSTPMNTEDSTSDIRAAEELGSADVPKASLHVLLAKEELEKARVLATNGDDDEASSMLSRAEVDAELAVVLSREDTEKASALAEIERVRQLRQENNLPVQN